MTNQDASAGWGLPEIGPGCPASPGLVARREAMRGLDALQIIDSSISISEVRIAGIPCVLAAPAEARGTFLYLHGGGYRLGEARTWSGLASRIAATAGIRVLVPDYGLAPERPFPGALAEALAVYQAIAEADDGPIFVGGDSAGGGLACSLVLALLAAGAAPPQGVVLVSPWLDLTPNADSFDRCAGSDATFSREAAIEAAEQYLQGHDPAHPLLSPLRADLAAFPPCLIAASSTEVLVDHSVQLAERLTRAGRPCQLNIETGLPHAWPILIPAAVETAALIDAAATFIARHAGR